MNALFSFLNSIPVDRYQHFGLAIFIFAAVHFFTGSALLGFAVQLGAHILKKVVNIAQDVHAGTPIDWADVVQDIGMGVLGGVAAWACLPVKA